MKRVIAIIVFLFVIFNSSFSLAKNDEKLTVEEIESIIFLSEEEKYRGFGARGLQKKEVSATITKRYQNRGFAKCLYKEQVQWTYHMKTVKEQKECAAEIINRAFKRGEKYKKKYPGDVFYALDAIEGLIFSWDERSKFLQYQYIVEGEKVGPEFKCEAWDWTPSDGIKRYTCYALKKKYLKRLEKFRKDPTNEKILGRALLKRIKNVRMVRSIRKKISNGHYHYSLLGDMLNATVSDVKKNNIRPELKQRRVLLEKYSLILSNIKKKLDQEKYKTLEKDVSILSKTFNKLNSLKSINDELTSNVDESVTVIFDTNKLTQTSILNAKNNEKEKLLALASINFMQTLLDSILSVIPEKYYTEQKILSKNLFKSHDLAELENIIDTMMITNKETKEAEFIESMKVINKSHKYLSPSDIVKSLENLGMKNDYNKTFDQNAAGEMAINHLKDNLDKKILKEANKFLKKVEKDNLSELNKEISNVAKEVSSVVKKEISGASASGASTPMWATTKPGNFNIKHLIQASRQGKISWGIGRR